jgi:hypothetical protein
MASKFKFDATKFEAIMIDYAEILKKTIPDSVALGARSLCVELARRTQPFGTSNASGIGRVDKDITKIIRDDNKLSEIIATVSTEKIRARLSTLLDAKRYDIIKIILSNLGFLGSWGGMEMTSDFRAVHKANRNATTGRTRNKSDKLYISTGNLPAYVEEVSKRVGIAKSGWARCAEQLPAVIGGSMTRGIPDWVASQTKGGGTIENNLSNAASPSVRMTNTVPWVSQICPPGEQLKASSIVVAKMKKQMNIILKTRQKTLTE